MKIDLIEILSCLAIVLLFILLISLVKQEPHQEGDLRGSVLVNCHNLEIKVNPGGENQLIECTKIK